jgi:hypothetical protein
MVPGTGVGVFVTVGVGVLVGVFVGVGETVAVAVGVLVGVSVGVAVGVAVGVFVGVLVAVGVTVGVSVGVLVSVGVMVGVSVGVLVAVGVMVGVSVGVLVAVGVAAALHPPTVSKPASVTVPSAVVKALPVRFTGTIMVPAPRSRPACATTFPAKLVPLRVAAALTCQNTLQGSAPLVRRTVERTLAVSALPTWKM